MGCIVVLSSGAGCRPRPDLIWLDRLANDDLHLQWLRDFRGSCWDGLNSAVAAQLAGGQRRPTLDEPLRLRGAHRLKFSRWQVMIRDDLVMAYDGELAERVRDLVGGAPGVTEQRMFGGLAFLINGNMSVTVSRKGGLMVRMDAEEADALIDDQHVKPVVMRGREMNGWLRVDTAAVKTETQLEQWVGRGISYARSLPAKK
jgi:TfoX/Sxy family transcriptional regulator of competence genes